LSAVSDEGKDSKYQNFTEAWGVGVVFYNNRNCESARQPFGAALKVATTDAEKLKVNEVLIGCYRLHPDTSKMKRVVEFVLTHSPSEVRKSIITRAALSFIHQRGKTKATVADHEKRLNKDSDSVLSLYLRCEIYSRTRPDAQRAVELLDRLAKLPPKKKGQKTNVCQTARLAMQSKE
jgi:hypothetical protein